MTKYIGPKTHGENVATQADKLSLSSDTPDALTPDQAGAVGTATTAARADHAHEIICAAAGAISGTATEGSASSFARSDHSHSYGTASILTAALADDAVTKAKVDATIYGRAQTISALTASGTLTATDLGQLVTVNSGSAATLTISGTILSAGERIDILQLGAGQVTLSGTLNTLVGTPGLKLRAQYSACTLYGLGGGTHVAIGDLAA